MKKFSKFKQYFKYHLKWQVGIFVSWPVMYILHDVLHWSNFSTIIGFQFIGAIVFYPLDKYIFSQNREISLKNSD